MKYFNPLLIAVLGFCSWGLWGCTQQKAGNISAKVQELETRYNKLEADYRVQQTNSELSRKKLEQAETERTTLEQEKIDLAGRLQKQKSELTRQVQAAIREGDELRKQLVQRTTERDSAQSNLTQFGKELQALVGRVETAVNNMPPSSSVMIVPASRRAD